VQIATGADRAGLPREFTRLRGLAPDQLRGKQAWTAPLRATNRLLVGPFASTREAQALVNALGTHDIQAFAWTSDAGQEIERLQTADEPRSTRSTGRAAPTGRSARTRDDADRPAARRAGGRSRTDARTTPSRARTRH
jgi:hypothetical protein